MSKDGNQVIKRSYPLVPSLSSWIQFLSKMSQIIIVVEVKERNQVLNRGNHFVFNSFENKTFRNEYK